MKSSELRIGNYIKQPNGVNMVFRISEGEDVNTFPEEEIEAIPLTEEWLLKFGWIWNDECNSYEKYPNGDARMNLSYHGINNSYTMFNYVLKATIVERIWYAHQLQNIYFALTGNELELQNNATRKSI